MTPAFKREQGAGSREQGESPSLKLGDNKEAAFL